MLLSPGQDAAIRRHANPLSIDGHGTGIACPVAAGSLKYHVDGSIRQFDAARVAVHGWVYCETVVWTGARPGHARVAAYQRTQSAVGPGVRPVHAQQRTGA